MMFEHVSPVTGNETCYDRRAPSSMIECRDSPRTSSPPAPYVCRLSYGRSNNPSGCSCTDPPHDRFYMRSPHVCLSADTWLYCDRTGCPSTHCLCGNPGSVLPPGLYVCRPSCGSYNRIMGYPGIWSSACGRLCIRLSSCRHGRHEG